MSQQVYRRSLRHMSSEALKEFLSAELHDYNELLAAISSEIADNSDTLTLEQLNEYLNTTHSSNPTLALIDDIVEQIKHVNEGSSSDQDNILSEADETKLAQESLYDTVHKLKESRLNKQIDCLNKAMLEAEQCIVTHRNQLTNAAEVNHLQEVRTQLMNQETTILHLYEEYKSWNGGKVNPDLRTHVDKLISSEIKEMLAKVNDLIDNPASNTNDDLESVSSGKSYKSVKSVIAATQAAVERARKKVEDLSMQSKAMHVESSIQTQHDLSESNIKTEKKSSTASTHDITVVQDLGLTIARAISESMATSRIAIPEPFTFYGDPLEYQDWEATFSAAVDRPGITEAEKMRHLQRCVGGEAKKAIKGFFLLNSADATKEARAMLKDRYGNDFSISDAFRKELENWPKIGNKDHKALLQFADFLRQCHTAMTTTPDLQSLNERSENQKMVDKLPDWLINMWKRKVNSFKIEHHTYPKFKTFADFVRTEADIACEQITTITSRPDHPRPQHVPKKVFNKRTTTMKTHTTESTSNEKRDMPRKFCHLCSMHNHNTTNCGILLKKSYEEVIDFIKNKHLCYGCLKTGHSSKYCNDKASCTKCSKKHPTCLHREQKEELKDQPEKLVVCAKTHDECLDNFTSSMIVPVWVSHEANPSHEILTYAMLDTQSNTTFILDHLQEQLACPSSRTTLTLTTLTSTKETTPCLKVNGLLVRGYRSDKRLTLPTTYSRQYIPFQKEHVPTKSKCRAWPHLAGVEPALEELFECDAGLLIGYDCSSALAPIESVRGCGNVPYAIKTELGWSVVGTTDRRSSGDKLGMAHHTISKETEGKLITFQLHKQVRERNIISSTEINRILESDFKDTQDTSKSISLEDRVFLDKLSSEISHQENDFVTMPLPFRTRPYLPNNRVMAERRLEMLSRKFKDNEYYSQYTAFMDDLLEQGYAEKAPAGDEDGQKWYLPHFGVFHHKKPGKIRVVFDGSAKYKDNSINQHLLQGPDLLNGLLGVLLRFRRNNIAIMCDIEKMFYRFKVKETDRDFLRYLWYDKDMKTINEYRMTVHIFGASSSPGCATFGLRYLAEKYQEDYPEASEFIQNSFYVDDGLTSVATEEEATHLITSVTELCTKGKIRLHKFVTNSKKVLENIPQSERSSTITDISIADGGLPTERALGILWSADKDAFLFKRTVAAQPRTRRGLLSIIASIYDPLGFLAPYTFRGKCILQELCRRKLGWDDPLPSDMSEMWDRWWTELSDLDYIEISRSLQLNGNLDKAEFHCFSDASTQGYGACLYIKVPDIGGEAKVSFLLGKARVAPLKVMTIPKLELQAAVLATQLASIAKRELGIDLTAVHFWCDSQIVLNSIRNDAKKFEVFVANRIQQIRNVTSPNQWHYVPSGANPADHASRGLDVNQLTESWISPPSLKHHKYQDDLQTDPHVQEPTSLKTATAEMAKESDQHPLLERILKFSSWNRLITAIKVLLRTITIRQGKTFTEYELKQRAINLTVRIAQSTLNVSDLTSLDPIKDSDYLVRVGGRLKFTPLDINLKHPLIIPHKSHLATLLIRHFHQSTGHGGKGMTMTAVRQAGYWIPKLSSSVSSVLYKCIPCKRISTRPMYQKMADLPEIRAVAKSGGPFTYVGMDCFGPFLVKDSRKEVKRYGLLFTCMTSRAIHVEMVDNLSTDAFMNAFRCLIAMRGNVKTIYSDQGTNFRGAEVEIKKALEEMRDTLKKQVLSQFNCEFEFNFPASSHMGGVWERQVRTVRRALKGLQSVRHALLTSSSLRALFYEVTGIVNSRPLTVENLNDPDSEILTPNHLLHLKSDVVLPSPGAFSEADGYSRKQWRRVQHMANVFWKQWRTSYLQTLQTRNKWTKTTEELKPNDLVMIMDDNPLRSDWRMAKVTDVIKSHDGRARKVKVVVSTKALDNHGRRAKSLVELERPINKIAVLVRF